MEKISAVQTSGTSIPAGQEILRLAMTQRGIFSGSSVNSWGKTYTWIFVLRNKLDIPTYSCTLNNANQTITLPPVMKKNLVDNGAGVYAEPVPFNLNLTCKQDTTVSIQFDGNTMSGKNDVLANSADGNQDVGIQLIYNNSPVKFAEKNKVIDMAGLNEVLPYEAHYYYNGGADIQGGEVKAVTTVTLTYQ